MYDVITSFTEYVSAEFRECSDGLLGGDSDLQQSVGVFDSDAASVAQIEGGDHTAVHNRLESLSRW